MVKINKFPEKKIRLPAGGTFDQLILIDNKEINQLLVKGRTTGMATVSNAIEMRLAKRIGFKGQSTDVSSKADFQQFSLVVKGEALETPESVPPVARSFVEALKATALGEGYDVTSKVAGTDEIVTGLGAELKLKKDIFDIEQVRQGQGRFSGVTITQEKERKTGKELRPGQAGFEEEKLLAAKTKFTGVGGEAGTFFARLLSDPGLASTVFENPAALSRLYKKTKNLFTLVSFKSPKGGTVNFLYFIKDLRPGDKDITGNWDPGTKRRRIQWEYTSGFEKRVVTRVSEMLGEDGAKAITSGQIKKQLGALGILSLEKDLKALRIETSLNSVSSIPIRTIANIKISKRKSTKKQAQKGRFISNVQLSAILQQRLEKVMPRYSEPQRPIPRYVTGKLAQSFRLLANYRTGIMGFYNTPPASGYVDQLNIGGWMLDKTLIEPTIRQITQQLFGRQFKVLRTQ